ncbi:unnamed protein product [Rhizophagus irregularis]|uniref:Uncharacterized protein n=1 Tax=Rhizophagus irregularis TaxID=588596 RepID=A0A916ECF0_9GLOM|nr:unnamed protein product [Rhizophagus irregularis]CAB5201656.1 unnamed protein product [Rhizophagus irregularis]CAB5371572.1 unnamed protein product [Rhizophagus irregularis]
MWGFILVWHNQFTDPIIDCHLRTDICHHRGLPKSPFLEFWKLRCDLNLVKISFSNSSPLDNVGPQILL